MCATLRNGWESEALSVTGNCPNVAMIQSQLSQMHAVPTAVLVRAIGISAALIQDCRAALSASNSAINSLERRSRISSAILCCSWPYRSKRCPWLLIAKLDRLSRNLAFIATLMDSGVEFLAVDNPHANKSTVHILAAVAQHEREMISERTRSALQAAKARGKKLGNPKVREAGVLGNIVIKDTARKFAANVLPVIREIQVGGAKSNAAIATKLNERRVPTARGGVWTHVQVQAVIGRGSTVT
ncbi:recombinase family protein [Bradyrhizobium lablabi]|uniref:recombinase family protein n=1 Tax=Bradyrhizobium lablabi TaxID=722472 RepID=UPI00090C5E7C|nr:recombinase family protein [Bradyrhizobium lablabi]SHK62399.1 Resolvase, N terminal domain [Bradyrhizobium lablabi]